MNVLALLAHPDDELMCAGTLARLVAEGNPVQLLTLFMDERQAEWEACAKTLGIKAGWWSQGAIPEDDFVWSRRTVRTVEQIVPTCDLLISHRAEDSNTSHAHIGRIARTLARKNRCSLWELDQTIPGGINPDCPPPNHFIDIDAWHLRKRDAMQCYPSQLDRYPGWIQAELSRNHAHGWEIGTGYAEAFRIVKSVWL